MSYGFPIVPLVSTGYQWGICIFFTNVQGTTSQGGIQLGNFRQKIPTEGRHEDLPLILCVNAKAIEGEALK